LRGADVLAMFREMSRRFDTATINLALSILRGVLPHCARNNVGTPAVRLALRVLHRHVGDITLEFWQHASSEACHPWQSGHQPYATMVARLREAGWEIEPVNLLY
jgi:hypothetical protein